MKMKNPASRSKKVCSTRTYSPLCQELRKGKTLRRLQRLNALDLATPLLSTKRMVLPKGSEWVSLSENLRRFLVDEAGIFWTIPPLVRRSSVEKYVMEYLQARGLIQYPFVRMTRVLYRLIPGDVYDLGFIQINQFLYLVLRCNLKSQSPPRPLFSAPREEPVLWDWAEALKESGEACLSLSPLKESGEVYLSLPSLKDGMEPWTPDEVGFDASCEDAWPLPIPEEEPTKPKQVRMATPPVARSPDARPIKPTEPAKIAEAPMRKPGKKRGRKPKNPSPASK